MPIAHPLTSPYITVAKIHAIVIIFYKPILVRQQQKTIFKKRLFKNPYTSLTSTAIKIK